MSVFIHPSAIVDDDVAIGQGTKIWHFSHVCTGANIGEDCSLGQNVMLGQDVMIGSRVKVQNNVSIYTGTTIEDEVFLGPSCVLTNVTNPRSQINRRGLYEETRICRGATVGANATIVCGISIGRYAFIAAGAVVTQSVPDYAFVVGVPGRQTGWMSRHGHLLRPDGSGRALCPESKFEYVLSESGMRCLSLLEGEPLPDILAIGHRSYDEFKSEHDDQSIADRSN